MSVGLHVDLSGLEALQGRIDRLAGLDGSRTRALLEDIGEMVESQTRRRIQEEKESPEGVDWPRLDPEYLARKKKKSSGGLLVFGEGLLDSIDFEVSGDSVEVGSNLIYAATHQMGDEKRNIQARQYLGLSPENEGDVVDIVDKFIDGLLQ